VGARLAAGGDLAPISQPAACSDSTRWGARPAAWGAWPAMGRDCSSSDLQPTTPIFSFKKYDDDQIVSIWSKIHDKIIETHHLLVCSTYQ
jgi:hypothetical protein